MHLRFIFSILDWYYIGIVFVGNKRLISYLPTKIFYCLINSIDLLIGFPLNKCKWDIQGEFFFYIFSFFKLLDFYFLKIGMIKKKYVYICTRDPDKHYLWRNFITVIFYFFFRYLKNLPNYYFGINSISLSY